jgi:hypothetical protein
VCLEALGIIRRRFRELEANVAPAQWVPWESQFNWRFTEQHVEQLLLQKLARQVSGIQTIDLLLMAGHLQEVGVLYRMLDEIEEDILFLVLGLQKEWTPHHEGYVKYFWSEDDNDKQPPVRRKNIRAFIHKVSGQADPSNGIANGRLIHKIYSDFIHVRSAPIMGMVAGPPARFELDGIHDARARFPFIDQNPTYFYRCLISSTAIANVLLPDKERASIYAELRSFEQKHAALLFGQA